MFPNPLATDTQIGTLTYCEQQMSIYMKAVQVSPLVKGQIRALAALFCLSTEFLGQAAGGHKKASDNGSRSL